MSELFLYNYTVISIWDLTWVPRPAPNSWWLSLSSAYRLHIMNKHHLTLHYATTTVVNHCNLARKILFILLIIVDLWHVMKNKKSTELNMHLKTWPRPQNVHLRFGGFFLCCCSWFIIHYNAIKVSFSQVMHTCIVYFILNN